VRCHIWLGSWCCPVKKTTCRLSGGPIREIGVHQKKGKPCIKEASMGGRTGQDSLDLNNSGGGTID